MVPSTIAIVADCDDTLAPDTTAQLLEFLGVDPDDFYKRRVKALVDSGYDPPVAYLTEIVKLGKLTEAMLPKIAKQMKFFPGVPGVFTELKADVTKRHGENGIRLELYVITGGIADLIALTKLGSVANDIWGCNLAFDEKGKACGIKNVVSFTEKTRFLFNIEKGLVGPTYKDQPYAVNSPMSSEERPVPLKNPLCQ